jgi:hypothetical protein
VTPFPPRLLPHRCRVCGSRTIVGHGRRRKQAHDQRHDRIWIRRGRCRPCRKTFTILPAWSPPYGHYSLHCRQQAWGPLRKADSWEESVPNTKEPDHVPDPSSVRRWAGQLFCFWILLATKLWQSTRWTRFKTSSSVISSIQELSGVTVAGADAAGLTCGVGVLRVGHPDFAPSRVLPHSASPLPRRLRACWTPLQAPACPPGSSPSAPSAVRGIQSFTGSFHFCLGSGLDRIKPSGPKPRFLAMLMSF